jgi:hypothetical protein
MNLRTRIALLLIAITVGPDSWWLVRAAWNGKPA